MIHLYVELWTQKINYLDVMMSYRWCHMDKNGLCYTHLLMWGDNSSPLYKDIDGSKILYNIILSLSFIIIHSLLYDKLMKWCLSFVWQNERMRYYMRDNIVGFYISFVRQKDKKIVFLCKRRTCILAYTVLLSVLRSLFVWIPIEAFVSSALVIRSA